METHCDRCGKDCRYNEYSDFVLVGELTSLLSVYSIWGVTNICKSCGDVANEIVGYWGKKTDEDTYKLMCYLQSGPVSSIKTMITYSALMNAGYHCEYLIK